MKELCVICAAALTFAAVAQSNETARADARAAAKAERQALAATKRLKAQKEFGGFIVNPASQKGRILIVNGQTKVSDGELEKVLEFFRRQYAYKVEIVTARSVSPATASAEMKARDANLAIFVVDDAAQPPMLTAPEDHWAFVNVAKLAHGAPSPAYTAARTRKSILRALAYLTACSANEAPMVDPFVKGPEDLDLIARPAFPVDIMIRMARYLRAIGVTRQEKTTYRAAIEAGYNIAPTNEYQKAIWDKVHAIPKNPMKIEFDPKKGR